MTSTPPPTAVHGPVWARRAGWRRPRPRLHTSVAREHGGTFAAAARRDADATVAREHGGTYAAAAAADTEASHTRPVDGPAVAFGADGANGLHDAADVSSGVFRDAIAVAAAAMRRVSALAADARVSSGQLEGLLELLQVVDQGQQAAVTLTGRVEQAGMAERSAALPLEGLLAMSSRLPHTERRELVRVAEQLRAMPHLTAAWQAGVVSYGQVRAILGETARLTAAQRCEVDATLTDLGRLRRFGADELVDAVRDHVTALTPTETQRKELRRIEGRFLALQPALDGALTGYFELDAEGAASVLDALDAASPAPSGPKDHTRDADHTPEPTSRWDKRASRARQRADGLVTLAETFLGGQRTDGTTRRAKPRVLVWADIDTLLGAGKPGQLLWNTIGGPVTLTPAGIRRLASDATLQTVLHHNGRILGTTDPTPTIPAQVRAAVTARDRGCRFPGCTMPIAHCDLHHITPREQSGPTTPDNLVAVCRRHHTAITNRAWTLTMTPDGTVTVRRGNRTATTDPPHRQTLHPDTTHRQPAHPA